MEGELYLAEQNFSKWTQNQEEHLTLNWVCEASLNRFVWPVPVFYLVTILLMTNIFKQHNTKLAPRKARRNEFHQFHLIPPRLPNKWKPVAKPRCQTTDQQQLTDKGTHHKRKRSSKPVLTYHVGTDLQATSRKARGASVGTTPGKRLGSTTKPMQILCWWNRQENCKN